MSAADNSTRMCTSCYCLFEKASSLLVTAHARDVNQLQQTFYDLLNALQAFRHQLSFSSQTLLEEVRVFMNKSASIVGMHELRLDDCKSIVKDNSKTETLLTQECRSAIDTSHLGSLHKQSAKHIGLFSRDSSLEHPRKESAVEAQVGKHQSRNLYSE